MGMGRRGRSGDGEERSEVGGEEGVRSGRGGGAEIFTSLLKVPDSMEDGRREGVAITLDISQEWNSKHRSFRP